MRWDANDGSATNHFHAADASRRLVTVIIVTVIMVVCAVLSQWLRT